MLRTYHGTEYDVYDGRQAMSPEDQARIIAQVNEGAALERAENARISKKRKRAAADQEQGDFWRRRLELNPRLLEGINPEDDWERPPSDNEDVEVYNTSPEPDEQPEEGYFENPIVIEDDLPEVPAYNEDYMDELAQDIIQDPDPEEHNVLQDPDPEDPEPPLMNDDEPMAAQNPNWQRFPAKAARTNLKRRWAGTPQQLFDTYGPSTKAVKSQLLRNKTPDQLAQMWTNRQNDAYTGAGRYRKRRRRKSYGRKRYYGRGGYWGKTIGKAAGSLFNAPWLEQVGDKAGDWITDTLPNIIQGKGMYTGRGAYDASTSSNSLVIGPHNDFNVPQFHPQVDGSSVMISHKEYIGDLFAPSVGTTFANQTYKVNPGIESTFPWLAQVAQNYVEYKIHQLIFTYKSTVADFAAASGQVGQIIAVTQYDANQPPMIDKRQMMEYDASQSCKTSSNLVMGVECDPAKNAGSAGKFIRTTPLDQGKDLNTYDVGTFNLAVHDTPATYANQVLGEVWVSYTIELRKPKVFTGRGLGIQRDVFTSPVWNGKTVLDQSNIGISKFNTLFGTQRDQELKCEKNTLNCDLTFTSPTLSGVPINATKWGTLFNNPNVTYSSKAVVLDQFANSQIEAYNIFTATNCNEHVLTIPATYSGNLRLDLIMDLNDDTAIVDAGALSILGTGNITPIEDFPHYLQKGGQTNQKFWTNTVINQGGVGSITQPQCVHFTLHLRVRQASDGVDNAIVFMTGTGGQISLKNTTVILEEYNTIGSYTQDGSNDHLVMVDATNTRVDLNTAWVA